MTFLFVNVFLFLLTFLRYKYLNKINRKSNMPHDLIKLPLRKTRVKYFDLINKKHERLKLKKKLKQFNSYLSTYGLAFETIQIKRVNENEKKNR